MSEDTIVSIDPGKPSQTIERMTNANGKPAIGIMTPFTIPVRYSVVCFTEADDPEHPEYEGFCFEARENITNGERRELLRLDAEVNDYQTWWMPAKEGDTHPKFGAYNPEDRPVDREWAMYTPFIRNWNAMAPNAETGDLQPLPAPSDIGPDALDYLELPLIRWMVQTLRLALIAGKGLKASVRKSKDTQEA